ncbi:MAG: NAD(P)H-hydrate dehydratase [Candidatus Thermoplasmatota archaeon]|nr:NAD(P)H-hydrate dehydratase [Candidatus Thermoplasmatota archaeon]
MQLKEFISLDANAKHYGINPFSLMESAGKGAAEELFRFHGKKILFICGSGNNGGDGFVAARELHSKGEKARVFCVSKPKALEARRAFGLLPEECLCSDRDLSSELKSCDVIVDCMLGVGVNGEPREPYSSIIDEINGANKMVVAMDVPSGIGTKKSVNANLTVTFHKIKEGLDKNTIVKDIGIPEEIEHLCGPGDVRGFFPKNRKESHKGENGRVAVVGGGPYTGAPMISAMAALRSGADLVYLCVPERIMSIEASFEPSLIVKRIDDIPKVDSILIGPGLGDEDIELAKRILDSSLKEGRNIVCDATILKSLGELNEKCIVTPHMGEFKVIEGKERDEEEVKRIAKKLGCTVLLKGSTDLISDGYRFKKNPVGHPSMTRGGTGDALSGLCAGLSSRASDAFECACMAAYINGRCGEIAFKRYSYGYTTMELVDLIPEALRGCFE